MSERRTAQELRKGPAELRARSLRTSPYTYGIDREQRRELHTPENCARTAQRIVTSRRDLAVWTPGGALYARTPPALGGRGSLGPEPRYTRSPRHKLRSPPCSTTVACSMTPPRTAATRGQGFQREVSSLVPRALQPTAPRVAPAVITMPADTAAALECAILELELLTPCWQNPAQFHERKSEVLAELRAIARNPALVRTIVRFGPAPGVAPPPTSSHTTSPHTLPRRPARRHRYPHPGLAPAGQSVLGLEVP
jgi:hypothetical protein